ncbi:magnesium chelatase domain-containing protein [Streptomyces microflavus]|uniref:magnesium chelatase domain-containing protein n=1 Tax=Streptomyces microflavus TaxID=1919 RepID=UPI00365364F9
MSTETTTRITEFIIVGQDRPTALTLLGIVPAPVDPTARAMYLEEIGVDAADLMATVYTRYAPTAQEAVDQVLATLRTQYRADTYGLLDPDRALTRTRETTVTGKATVVSGIRDAGYLIRATAAPGEPSFALTGVPFRNLGSNWIRDRVRAGVINSGQVWPMCTVTVDVTTRKDRSEITCIGSSGLDLAIACATLAASGQLPEECLAGAALVGELGLDGGVRVPYGLPSTVRRIVDGGTTTVLVPTSAVKDLAHTGARLIGVGSLTEALAVLAGHWHHAGCAHCDRGITAAHRPCTPDVLCQACLTDAPF